MFRTLLKKQFLELASFYLKDRKNGRIKVGKSAVGMIILYAVIFGLLAFSFFAMFASMALALGSAGLGWLYFLLVTVVALILGVFGGVFSTYSALYLAKDNETLLSMPIPPVIIITVRMIAVFATGMLYCSLVYIPAVIVYVAFVGVTIPLIIGVFLGWLSVGIVTLVLSCLLGWVVAMISSKLKNKSFVTVILSLAFIGVYYLFYFRLDSFITTLVGQGGEIAEKVQTKAYPLFLIGDAAAGNVPAALVAFAVCAALLALTCYLMSANFIKIITAAPSQSKKVYKGEAGHASSLGKSLLKRELRHFVSSPTYMLNCGLGLVMMLGLSVFALIKAKDGLRVALADPGVPPVIPQIVVAIAMGAVCMLASMNYISTPSVSLEGKHYWLIRSLPVPSYEVLRAKYMMQIIIDLPVTVITAIIISIVIGADVASAVCMILAVSAYVCFSAVGGVILGLKFPNIYWTTEAAVVKQGTAVFIALFGGWLVSALSAGIAVLLALTPVGNFGILAVAVLFAVLTVVCDRWLKDRGSVLFEEL